MNALPTEAASVVSIPLNRLKASPKNVRKIPHTREHICQLADSIDVRDQLQNLVVEPECDEAGAATGYWLVNVGEGRRLAQLERVARGTIPEDHPIRCLINASDPAGASLAENIHRAAMHPADQFEAFKERAERGESIEDIAAGFGVAPEVVRRRLKLANVAPSLFVLYRRNELTLDQLMAFTITDDHARQEQVWAGLKPHDRDPHRIRHQLAQTEISNKSPLARFVGAAYRKSGGAFREDLFSKDNESFAVDVELLTRLANEKLDRAASKLRKTGLKWVETQIDCDLADLSGFARVRRMRREPTEAEAHRFEEIDAELQSLDETDEQDEALADRIEALQEERERIDEACEVPDPEQQAVAGALVTIDYDGSLIIHEGLLKPEDAARFRARDPATPARRAAPRLHSAALTRRLTAHRTAALRATLARSPEVALAVLTQRLALPLLFGIHHHCGPVQIETTVTRLKDHAPDIVQSKAHVALEDELVRWRERLPQDEEQVLPWLLQQPAQDVQALLALCVASAVSDVTASEDAQDEGRQVRAAARLDMREWWEAKADTYFGSVPKARIAAVLCEAVSEGAASTVSQLTKADAAKLAEQQLAGKGWLPEILRT